MSEETKVDVAENGDITTGKPGGFTYETYVRSVLQEEDLVAVEL